MPPQGRFSSYRSEQSNVLNPFLGRQTRLALSASCILLAGVSVPAFAQQSGLPTRQQIQLPERVTPPTPPSVTVTNEAPRSASCPFRGNGLTATIDTLSFVGPGNAALPPEIAALLADLRPSAGELPITQLCDLRDAAAARLSAAGYIAAVTIPPQEISRDARTAQLLVIPARLVAVEVVGNSGASADRIASRADRLKSIYPLRTSQVERELLLASDTPGLDVKMTLVSAGTAPGEVIGRLEVSRRAFEVIANLQNYGSRAIGRENGSVRAEFYGLTGLSDLTFVGASSTSDLQEQWTVQGGHYFSLDSGLTFGGSVTYAESRPGIGALDLRANSLLAAAEAYAPVVRTVASRVTVGAGLELIDQESNLHGGGLSAPLTRDRLRVAFLKLEASNRTLRADGSEALSLNGTLQLRKGLDILGASKRGQFDGGYLPSNIEGDPTAFLVRGGLTTRAQSGRFALLARIEGQYSAKPLLGFEEYALGNFTIGRGYDPATMLGDSALGGRLQPSFFVGFGRSVVEPYAFADAVRIWNEDAFAPDNGRTLASAGVGARLYLANRFIIDAAWAHPFDRANNVPGAQRAPDRLLVSLTAAFGPKGR
jgi:hemolysin activation/secretion protein